MNKRLARPVVAAWAAVALAVFVLGLASAGVSIPSSVAATDPVIAVAGDSCGSSTSCAATASLIDGINPDALLTVGDNAYEDGTLTQYNSYYKPNWGRHDYRVYPSPGNHDFHTANAQGYRDYFGARAPALTYSYNLGAWHVVSLAGGGVSVSTQDAWLKADLAANPSQCLLAYWHEPKFSSGSVHGNSSSYNALWTTLYAAGADVILNGHDHNYQRYAKLNPSGNPDPAGIREFVVGTGGWGHYGFTTTTPMPEVRNGTDYGVMKMTLGAGSYTWQFVPVAGSTFTDSGSDTCSGAAPPPPTTATTATTTTGTTTTTPTPGARIPWRFAYSNRGDQNLAVQYGYNLIDVSTKGEADATPAGTQGQVWLYDYNNVTCTWEKDDTYITNVVSSAATDPKVAGFYFSNEPDPFACPSAPQQHKDRNALIKSLAPTKFTLVGIDANWRDHFDRYGTMWKGVADYVNYNPYVCFVANTTSCDLVWEDHVLQVAEQLGQPYFVALQAFKGDEWRWPTASEERQMLQRLCGTSAQGYLTFSWNWQSDPLTDHPDVLAEIQNFNLNGCAAPTPRKITICHHARAKSGAVKHVTIRINRSAWSAHQRHGDSVGACNTATAKKFHSRPAHVKKFHRKKK